MYIIGKRIKMFREKKGLSQKDFASMIGQKNGTVSNWERGHTRPDVDTLVEICKALDVSADELLDIRVNMQDMSETEQKIIMAYREKKEIQHSVNILLGLSDNGYA